MKLRFSEKIRQLCKELFLFEKKSIALHSFLLLSMVLLINSSAVLFSHLPTNKAMSLAEISERYKQDLSEEPATIIYGKEIAPNSYELLPCEAEKSKALRSVYSTQVCFDGYLANWENKYSPVVTTVSGIEKEFSVLLWPKNGYRDSSFLYEMPLLAGSVRSQSTSQDLYITKAYADELIVSASDIDPSSDEKYGILLEKMPQIDLDYKTTSSYERTFQTYFLCGVIDDSSEEYREYQQLFGDFFVSNQYLTLPIPHFTYFETTNGLYNKRTQIQTILNVYQYQARKVYGSAINAQYAFEYRLFFVGDLASRHPIDSVWDDVDTLFQSTSRLFDLFCYGDAILPVVVAASLSVSFVVLVLFLTRKIKKAFVGYFRNEDRRINIIWKIMKYCLYFSLAAAFGFLSLRLIKILIPSLSVLSVYSLFTPLLYFVLSLIVVVFLFAFRKEKKNNGVFYTNSRFQ